jgi:hypothetical protein
MKQERNLLLTTSQLCNVKGKEFLRSIGVKIMRGLSKNTLPGNDEFVVHVADEYDYRFICPLRDELITSIKAVYFNAMNANLPIYGTDKNLKEFATSKKDVANRIEKIPPNTCRLYDEDVFEPIGSNPSMSSAILSTDSSDE